MSKNGSIRDGLKKSMLPPGVTMIAVALEERRRRARSRRGRRGAAGRRCPAAAGRRSPPCWRRCSGCAGWTPRRSPTSKRSGSVAEAAARTRARSRRPPARLKRSGLVSMRRDQTPSCTTTVPLSTSALIVPCSAEIGVDDRAEPFGIAHRHALADRRQAEVPDARSRSRPMRPPKVTLPPPSRPVTSSMRMPLASNETRAVDRFERVRQREMPEPPVGDAWRCRRTPGW